VELFFNFVGAFVALGLFCLWLRILALNADRRMNWATQLVALSLLVLILFPVISVTDDLIAVQNPAETDSIQRRNLEVSMLHVAVAHADLPIDAFFTPDPLVRCRFGSRAEHIPLPLTPALAPIENRPPPTA
jgi:hypothetical protein